MDLSPIFLSCRRNKTKINAKTVLHSNKVSLSYTFKCLNNKNV